MIAFLLSNQNDNRKVKMLNCYFAIQSHRRSRGSQGAMLSNIISISTPFVLRQAGSQTKHCSSPVI